MNTLSVILRHIERVAVLVGVAAVAAAAASPACAQGTEQHRSAADRRFHSLPDDGSIRAAKRVEQGDPVAHALAVGAAQAARRQYLEAIATYTQALRVAPDVAVLYRWRGHRRLTVRDFIGARQDLQTAAQLDSALYGAWYHLGVVDFVNGDFGDAVRAFRRALPLAPDAAERAGSTDWLWQSLSRRGLHGEAQALLAGRPDSIPVENAYARRLRLYRGEIGPADVIVPRDTADVQRATLAFGVGSWFSVRNEPTQAADWFTRALEATEGWPAFGYIGAEAALDGRTGWGSGVSDGVTRACLAAVVPTSLTPQAVRLVMRWSPELKETAAIVEARTQFVQALQAIAEEVRQSFGSPDGATPVDARLTWRQLDGMRVLTAHRDGRWTRDSVSDMATATDSTESAAMLAVERGIDATFAFGASRFRWPADLPGDRFEARLSLEVAPELPAPEAAPSAAIRVFSIRHPVERPAQAINNRAPAYPDDALNSGVNGTVILRFVIEATGRVRMASVREEWPESLTRPRGDARRWYDAFLAAALTSLANARFRPAELGGCKVPRLVTQAFVFEQR